MHTLQTLLFPGSLMATVCITEFPKGIYQAVGCCLLEQGCYDHTLFRLSLKRHVLSNSLCFGKFNSHCLSPRSLFWFTEESSEIKEGGRVTERVGGGGGGGRERGEERRERDKEISH